MKSNPNSHPSILFTRKLTAVSSMWVIALVFCMGCGSKQVVVIPDYDNDHYRSGELKRPDVEVVKTIDARHSSPNLVGTASVGMFNSKVPYLLSEPVSEFITKSINTMLDADPQTERICPVTVRIDAFTVSESTGFGESGLADCQLSFSFPVNADSTSAIGTGAVKKSKSYMDVTSSLEGLLYKCVADCTNQFLVDSYDPAPSHLLVARSDTTSAVDDDLRAESSLVLSRSPSSAESPYLQDPSTYSWKGLAFLYHHFTTEDMQDAYGHGFGLTFMRLQNLNRNLCLGFEMGVLWASGTPVEKPTSNWTVDSSNLFSLSVPINISLMYPPARGFRESSFRPYAGIGVGGILGLERMEADLSGYGTWVEIHHGVFQSAWTGEVILGSEFGQGAACLFAEIRLLLSGRSNISGGLSDEEQEEADQTLYDALIRPEGRMTGGQILLGLRF